MARLSASSCGWQQLAESVFPEEIKYVLKYTLRPVSITGLSCL
jgi:hypothetical protein